MTMMTDLEEVLLKVALRIAKRGEKAFFILGEIDHSVESKQGVPHFDIRTNPKLLESLALLGGAVIIDKNGIITAYNAKAYAGFYIFRKKLATPIAASRKGNIVVYVSDKDQKVRIYQNKKIIMQIDALEKNIDRSVGTIVNILQGVGAGTIGAVGSHVVDPGIGLAIVPGIILFGSAYYLTKLLLERKISKKKKE